MKASSIKIFLTNGRQHTFNPQSAHELQKIEQEIKSKRLFQKSVSLFATDQYLVHIQTKAIEMIHCLDSESIQNTPLQNEEDIVEITKEDLIKQYMELPEEEKYSSRQKTPGEFMTTFLEIHTQGNREIFLRLHTQKRKSQEGREFITHLFEQSAMEFRLQSGGFGILKPSAITAQFTYPGPSADVLPVDTFLIK
tara:strand:- start:26649 stop:27233 length:585 start_codon:yes stop_codon:yes gene_type:complete